MSSQRYETESRTKQLCRHFLYVQTLLTDIWYCLRRFFIAICDNSKIYTFYSKAKYAVEISNYINGLWSTWLSNWCLWTLIPYASSKGSWSKIVVTSILVYRFDGCFSIWWVYQQSLSLSAKLHILSTSLKYFLLENNATKHSIVHFFGNCKSGFRSSNDVRCWVQWCFFIAISCKVSLVNFLLFQALSEYHRHFLRSSWEATTDLCHEVLPLRIVTPIPYSTPKSKTLSHLSNCVKFYVEDLKSYKLMSQLDTYPSSLQAHTLKSFLSFLLSC